MDRKKVREKQRAVKDAMKLQKAIGQLEAKAAEAGKAGDPFAKFFGTMAGALGDLVNQAQAAKDETGETYSADDLPFADLVNQLETDTVAEAFTDDLPFGHVMDEDDDELMEDEENV